MIALLPNVFSAKIEGTTYDLSLEKIEDTIVEIDTSPPQRQVAKEGRYLFNINPGEYTIRAVYNKDQIDELSATEKIKITQEGKFTLDLIMLPSLEEEITDPDLEILETKTSSIKYFIITILILLIIFIIFAVKRKKIKKTETQEGSEEDVKKVISFIKSKQGRATQKELRKEFPLSEAKISLILTELEHKGKIEKIKKGRGNIIVLKE